MEKLKEAYVALNPNAEIEVQMSDSSTASTWPLMAAATSAWRPANSRTANSKRGVTPTVIAIDGIAIIVNLGNPITGLTSDLVRSIYVGEITNWAEAK